MCVDGKACELVLAFRKTVNEEKNVAMRGPQNPECIPRIALAIAMSPVARCIELTDSRLHNTGCRRLCAGLGASPLITRLNLANAGLAAESCAHLGAFLKTAPYMNILGLADNPLCDPRRDSADGARGIGALCDGIIAATSLEVVVLSKCRIGDRACIALARAIAGSRALRTLVLSENPIGDRGFETLALGVPHSTSLQRLDLDATSGAGKPRAVEALMEGMRASFSLNILNVTKVGAQEPRAIGSDANGKPHRVANYSLPLPAPSPVDADTTLLRLVAPLMGLVPVIARMIPQLEKLQVVVMHTLGAQPYPDIVRAVLAHPNAPLLVIK